jgi:hypothetical protein
MHCSTCYREYLDTKRELQAMDSENDQPMPKRVEKRLERTLDQLDQLMRSAPPRSGHR